MRSLLMRWFAISSCAGLVMQLAVVDPAFAQNTEASATQEQSGSSATPAANADAKPKATVRSSYAREILSRFAPAITFYYAASPTDSDAYQFRHQLGFIFGLDYAALDTLILSSEIAIYRELGEPIERFVASNWEFGATKTFQIPYAGMLLPRFYFNLPTNPDDREYLSYRGAIGLDVELRKSSLYSPRKNHVFGASVGIGTLRRIYEYDTNQAGYNNQAWQYSMYLSANYKYRDWLMFLLKFGNNWNWYVNGNRANDTYRLTASVNYSPYKQFWLALAWDNADRTFLYDQISSNVNLYSPQGTNIILWLTYLPRISKTHDLAL